MDISSCTNLKRMLPAAVFIPQLKSQEITHSGNSAGTLPHHYKENIDSYIVFRGAASGCGGWGWDEILIFVKFGGVNPDMGVLRKTAISFEAFLAIPRQPS